MRIRFCGFGGQGVVLSGVIWGEAAVIDGKNAIQTQSYGSESMGGACRSDVVISDDEILDLELTELDVLVALSRPAYDAHSKYLKEDGLLIVDQDLVSVQPGKFRLCQIPASDMAERTFGKKIIANAIVLGCLAALAGGVSTESLEVSIRKNVPERFSAINIEAFHLGYRYGLSEIEPTVQREDK